MSLCLRLASRRSAALLRQQGQVARAACLTTSAPVSAIQKYSAEEWEKKNQRMGRPMSPHLSIYKFQLTSILSITHRATGLALHFGLLGFAGAMVMLPNTYPHYLGLVSATAGGTVLLSAAKFIISWPFFYHTYNGVRHLVWDMGKGFSLKTLYKSGYAVVGLSVVSALIAAVI